MVNSVSLKESVVAQSRRALHRLGFSHATKESDQLDSDAQLSNENMTQRAMIRLGERSLFLDKQPEAAIHFFMQAMQRGSALAKAILGFCTEFGLGCTMDFKQAERLYIEASAQGNGLAMARLAFLRKYGRPDVVIDRVESDEWQARVNAIGPDSIAWLMDGAIKYHDASCQYAIGVCYHDGVGVPKNEGLAVYCLCFYWRIHLTMQGIASRPNRIIHADKEFWDFAMARGLAWNATSKWRSSITCWPQSRANPLPSTMSATVGKKVWFLYHGHQSHLCRYRSRQE
jgi:hypothetical protein